MVFAARTIALDAFRATFGEAFISTTCQKTKKQSKTTRLIDMTISTTYIFLVRLPCCQAGCDRDFPNLVSHSLPETARCPQEQRLGRASGTRSFQNTNRAGSTVNATARLDNQRCVVKTGALKEADGFLSHCRPSVNDTRVRVRGFRLVKVEPRRSKSSELVASKRQFKQQRIRKGYSVCNRLNARN